jgi:hypothetical protein
MEQGALFSFAGVSLALNALGFFGAWLYGRKTQEFRWSEYAALMATPNVLVAFYAFFINAQIIRLYLISAVVGFALEYLLGFAYHKVLNKRLWTYSYANLGGYTSLLTFPMWGVAGVVFWFLGKMAGLS